MRKPGYKNFNVMPKRGKQVSVISHENLKLAVFLEMHLRLGNNGRHEGRLHLLVGQRRLEDKNKDPDVLPKVNKADIVEMVKLIEEYFRSHQGVIRAPLAHVIKKP